MTVLSAQSIREARPVEPFREKYRDSAGNSGGLGPCGYDLAIAESLRLEPGQFALASTIEKFNLPLDVVAIMHDKSSLARRGVAVQNTVAEPGWRGHLTLEITNHGRETVLLTRGDAICQAVFHRLDRPTDLPYDGKYQDQAAGPQEAR